MDCLGFSSPVPVPNAAGSVQDRCSIPPELVVTTTWCIGEIGPRVLDGLNLGTQVTHNPLHIPMEHSFVIVSFGRQVGIYP